MTEATLEGLAYPAELVGLARSANRAVRWAGVVGFKTLSGMVATIYNPDTEEDYQHTVDTFVADVEANVSFDLPFDLRVAAEAVKKTMLSAASPNGPGSGLTSPRLAFVVRQCVAEFGRQFARAFGWEDTELAVQEFLALESYESKLQTFVASLSPADLAKLLDDYELERRPTAEDRDRAALRISSDIL